MLHAMLSRCLVSFRPLSTFGAVAYWPRSAVFVRLPGLWVLRQTMFIASTWC
jgi:hypothetical protein